MSTIILDIVKLEKPIMVSLKNKKQYDPEDSQYKRLLAENGENESDLEVCPYAIHLADASGCTMFDPHPTLESAIEWIRENLFQDHVYIDGNFRENKSELEERLGCKIPDEKIYGWKERIALEKSVESYLTVSEAAKMTGYTTARIRQLCIAGKIMAVKKSFGWLIPAAELEKLKRKK
jgi:acyl carrier protein